MLYKLAVKSYTERRRQWREGYGPPERKGGIGFGKGLAIAGVTVGGLAAASPGFRKDLKSGASRIGKFFSRSSTGVPMKGQTAKTVAFLNPANKRNPSILQSKQLKHMSSPLYNKPASVTSVVSKIKPKVIAPTLSKFRQGPLTNTESTVLSALNRGWIPR